MADVLLLIVGGMFAGVVNTMAGGGSVLTVPLLVLSGVPGTAANGSNRVGVLTSSIAAYIAFHRQGQLVDRPLLARVLPVALLGVASGSIAVSQLSDAGFERLFGFLMIPIVIFSVLRPGSESSGVAWSTTRYRVVFFAIGLYAGAIQAGVGLILLAALGRSGMDLVSANVVKVVFTAVATLIALPVFIYHNDVRWLPGLALAAGLSLGAFVGARITVRGGERAVRIAMALAAALLGLRLLGLSDWIAG